MSFNHDKILNVLKTSLSKIANHERLSNIVKKDLSHYMQKLFAIKNSKGLIQYFTLHNASRKAFSNITEVISLTSHITQDTQEVKTSITKEELGDSSKSPNQWKKEISKTQLVSQVQHILASIEEAGTEASFQSRIEALLSYISRNPDARIISVKNGGVRILLRSRQKYRNADQGALREALALLGYSDPVPGSGIRILSIDGGGIRALLVMEMLKKLEELTGKRVYELFDIICGTSTGAILAFSVGIYHKSLDEIAKIYLDISNEVFKQSPLWGTGNLMWTQSYYSTPLWEKNLKKHLGDFKLIETAQDPLCPKLCVISAIVNQSHLSAYLFRNYSLPWKVQSQYPGNYSHRVWEAARASAAAPTYFEEFKLGEFIHQDGGILVNNPTAIAIHEAKLIWPGQPIQCVVSFGTGRTVPVSNREKNNTIDSSVNTSWKNKFFKILDSATDTEGVHIMLNDLLPDKVYYRFNPYLTEMVNMAEIDESKLEQLRRDALMYLRSNEDKFHAAAKVLSEPKSYVQKSVDWMNFKRELHGF